MDAHVEAAVEGGCDVVVVGGGAAGLSGALTLSRAGRAVLVVDAGQPRNAPAAGVHNYLGREGSAPGDLLETGRAEVARYGGRVVDGLVTAVRRTDDGAFAVVVDGGTDGGTEVRARRLLVTTGLVDELPDVPGVAELWGTDVLHCPFCHGWEVRGQAVGVLGTSPMAVHQALMWRGWSEDVTLFLAGCPEPTEEQAEQLAARGVAVVEGPVAALEVDGGRLTGVRLASGAVVPRQALVVATRVVARSGVLADLGLEPVDVEVGGHVLGSRVPTGPTGATEVPGVWAAGNAAEPMAQVIACAAAGMTAGAAITGDLLADDTARAVAALRASRAVTA